MQKRLVLVLAVNVDQHLAEGFQVGHGHRRAVDIALGAAVAIHHPAQYAAVGVWLQFQVIVCKPLSGSGDIAGVELGTDVGLVGAAADHRLVGSVAEGKAQRAEHDRFAGTGLAGDHRHAGLELDLKDIDGGVILDGKQLKHSNKVYGISREKCTHCSK